MNPKETLKKIMVMLGMEVSLESLKLDNGVEIEADAFEPGQAVFIVEGEAKIALPVGDYTLEDGRILVVSEEGFIDEIKEASEEEEAPVEEPVPAEQPVAASEVTPETSTPKKVVKTVTEEFHFSKIQELEATIAEKEAIIAELTKEKESEVIEEEVELSVEPQTHNPEAAVETKLKKFSGKRMRTTQDIVFEKLFKK